MSSSEGAVYLFLVRFVYFERGVGCCSEFVTAVKMRVGAFMSRYRKWCFRIVLSMVDTAAAVSRYYYRYLNFVRVAF